MASDTQETREIAQRILSAGFGEPLTLNTGNALHDRDHVFRFSVLNGPSAAPSHIIVKQTRSWGGAYDLQSTDPDNPAWGLLDDWAGLQFLNEVAGDVELAPRFYGGDIQAGLIVIEDLGARDRPDGLLLGGDAVAAERSLVEIATTLGVMHARTIGKKTDFDRIRDALGKGRPQHPDPAAVLGRALRATIETLGVKPAPGLERDLDELAAAIRDPGPFLAYTHGDPCPDNWLYTVGALRLLDFERGAFRHALLDGVYGRMHFPTCWCVNRLPAEIPLRMEHAYRNELMKGCPEAGDAELFGRAVVQACAYWAIDMCKWIIRRSPWYEQARPIEHDQEWGISTLRKRALVRSDILVRTTEEFDYLTGIGSAFREIAVKLRSVWPVEADTMPVYPAFQESAP